MTEKFKSIRVARRKMIRVANQVVATAHRCNKRYNDGHTAKNPITVCNQLRRCPARRFSPLVAA